MKKRIVCLFLVVLFLLTGCAQDPNAGETSDSMIESDQQSESSSDSEVGDNKTEPAAQIALVDGGRAKYILVCENAEYYSMAELLASSLESQLGVKFTVRRFDRAEPGFKKLYVACDYSDVMEEQPSLLGTYGVIHKDGDLYFYFDNQIGASQCIADFMKLLSLDIISQDANGKTQVILSADQLFWCDAEPNPYEGTLLGAPFGEYRIVISADAIDAEKYFVRDLANTLTSFTRRKIAVVTDDTEPSGRELVIGNTTRAGSAEFYGNDPEPFSFAIKGIEDDVYIGYSEIYCLTFAIEQFSTMMDEENDSVDIENTTTVLGNTVEREQANDVRVMTSNVLFCNHPVKLSDEETEYYRARMQMMAGYYKLHMPDFIGLQECFYMMRDALTPYLPEEYEFVDFHSNIASLDYIPVLYNAEKWEIAEYGTCDASSAGGPWAYVWVTFSRLGDPTDRYTLVNLHYSFVQGHPQRLPLAEKVNEFLKAELQRNPNTPIAVTGDYNAGFESDVFATQVNGIPMNTSFLLAENTNHSNGGIDHISVTSETVDVVCHRINNDRNAHFMSDHASHFADLRKKTASNT